MTEKVTPFLNKTKTIRKILNTQVKNTLEENSAENVEEMNFEFTPPGTPQKNGMVEWVFYTLYSWMCAMMSHMELHTYLDTGLWTKCVSTATKLEKIMVNPHKEKCAHEKLYGKIIDYGKYLSTWEKWELYAVSLP